MTLDFKKWENIEALFKLDACRAESTGLLAAITVMQLPRSRDACMCVYLPGKTPATWRPQPGSSVMPRPTQGSTCHSHVVVAYWIAKCEGYCLRWSHSDGLLIIAASPSSKVCYSCEWLKLAAIPPAIYCVPNMFWTSVIKSSHWIFITTCDG